MKVLVLCHGYDENKSGISKYMNSVLKELSQNESYHIDAIFNPRDFSCMDFSLKNLNINYQQSSQLTNKSFFSMLYCLFVMPFKVLFSDYDYVVLPAGNRRLLAIPFRGTKYVMVLHDLSILKVKNKYGGLHDIYFKKVVRFFLRSYPSINCISSSTKKDYVHYFKPPKNQKIQVVYNGIRELERVECENSSYKNSFIYVSRLEAPGKNHLRLVEAYAKLPLDLREKHKLYLLGKDWNAKNEILNKVKEHGLEEHVIVKNHVSDNELAEAYSNAMAQVFPSLYEGFGLPVLESMSFGLPVICSDTSSLPEVGGSAVKYFDPLNVKQIVSRMQEVINSKSLRETLSELGAKRARLFSWKKHTRQIMENAA
jgi:glycosyltransferase involved in cell wall biosynthesis